MDMQLVGNQIAALRRQKGLTQNQLGERLGVSYQAVSKWERGETLPDTGILVNLADVLETTVDYILNGGQMKLRYNGRITVTQMAEGLNALKRMGELLGRDNLLYCAAIDGINSRLQTRIEDAFTDERVFECFVAELVLQNLSAGRYVDVTDVKNSFRSEHFRQIVLRRCEACGIK